MTSSPDPVPASIAVGVDASEQSLAALTWAAALAGECGASLTAVMSWNYPTPLLLPVIGAPVLPADAMAALTLETLEGILADHPARESVTSLATPMGSARSVLVDSSEDHDLLVLGRTGRGRMERLVLGSTAAHVARHAHCPVVLVRNGSVPDSIMVAVDGSAQSVAALAWTLRLPGDRDVLAVYSHDESILDDLPLQSEVRAAFDERGAELLGEAVAAAAEAAGVPIDRVRTEVRAGDPRTSIVEAADPDTLLVVGARGHSGLAAWVLGSLADFALHHAPGPLLIWTDAA